MQIADLAKKLDLSENELRIRVGDLGFEMGPEDTEIEDDLADLLIDELDGEKTEAELAGVVIEEQLEREIVRSQSKQALTSTKEPVKKV